MEDAEGREGMCRVVRGAGMWRRMRRKRGEEGEKQEIKEKERM